MCGCVSARGVWFLAATDICITAMSGVLGDDTNIAVKDNRAYLWEEKQKDEWKITELFAGFTVISIC